MVTLSWPINSEKTHPRPESAALNWDGSVVLIPGAQAPHCGVTTVPPCDKSVRPGVLHIDKVLHNFTYWHTLCRCVTLADTIVFSQVTNDLAMCEREDSEEESQISRLA